MRTLSPGLKALTTQDELAEVQAVGSKRQIVTLRRTFNQSDFKGGYIKFWRVVAPTTHRNYESDLSIEGLREWGII